MKKIVMLTRYDVNGASSRMRFFQYLSPLSLAGFDVLIEPLISDDALASRYQSGAYGIFLLIKLYWRRLLFIWSLPKNVLLIIEKELFPWAPAWFELFFLRGRSYCLDFDDAIFHNYDLHKNKIVRFLFGKKIDCLMASADLNIVGNSYIKDRATLSGGKGNVFYLPTVIDLARYTAIMTPDDKKPLRIVWIGSPSTLKYLDLLQPVLSSLAQRHQFILRVIASGYYEMQGVQVEAITWSNEAEVGLIAECDIGVMPLEDTPWEQGKCAYKLIQYMACGLPVLGSPVGANKEVVIEGLTGYLPQNQDQWVSYLESLLLDPLLRQNLGRNGRERAASNFSLQYSAPRLVIALNRLLEPE